jgi:hypothetical protein
MEIKKGEVLAAAVQKLDYIKDLEINELQQQPVQEELEIELETIYKDLENNREVLNLNKFDLKEIKKDEDK